ncbi:MAG: 16S rRNA (guanine(966)-N(2))-methyltransferase RsmD [Gaiellaceae bacterium]
MRIIAGSRKGHGIATPRGVGTRPTSDRAREAVFNLINPVDDATVLDLFAGSGGMGLEALSRGARRCTFVESDRDAVRVIQANLSKVGLSGAVVDKRDALVFLREARARGTTYDLVFCDPPYGDWERLAGDLAVLLPPVLAEEGVLAVETGARTEPQLPLALVTTRRYGSARISVFTR